MKVITKRREENKRGYESEREQQKREAQVGTSLDPGNGPDFGLVYFL